jgi:hypothetical protein
VESDEERGIINAPTLFIAKYFAYSPDFLAHFSASKKPPLDNHVYHAFHHVFTTKKPRLTNHFSQNTPQIRPKQQKTDTIHRLKKIPDQ